jgi:hypothetical protein
LQHVPQTSAAGLIAMTMVCFVLINVVIALVLIRVMYPGSGLQLGTAALTGVAVLAGISLVFLVAGWRRYLNRPKSTRRS